mmetsp:Transcript_12652/g.57078  ORF Transcript_12652/g.57078 Transcript_12652/m.57078 type:complete len:458 (-) Transcript_12652:619-1992(-)
MTNAPDYFTIILRLFYDGAFVAAEVPAPSPEQIVERTLLHRASHRLPILRGLLPGPPHRTPPRCTPLVNHGGERAVVNHCATRRAKGAERVHVSVPFPRHGAHQPPQPDAVLPRVPVAYEIRARLAGVRFKKRLERVQRGFDLPTRAFVQPGRVEPGARRVDEGSERTPRATPGGDGSVLVRQHLQQGRNHVRPAPDDVVEVLPDEPVLHRRLAPSRGSALKVRNLVQKRQRQPPLLDHDAVPHGEHAVYPVGRGQERAPAALQGRHPERGQFRGRINGARRGSGGASRVVKLRARSQGRPRRIAAHLASVGQAVRRGVEQIQRALLHRLVHHAVLRDPLVILPSREHEELAHRTPGRAQQLAPVGAAKRVSADPSLNVPAHRKPHLKHKLAAVVEVPPGERPRGAEPRGHVERHAHPAGPVKGALRRERRLVTLRVDRVVSSVRLLRGLLDRRRVR